MFRLVDQSQAYHSFGQVIKKRSVNVRWLGLADNVGHKTHYILMRIRDAVFLRIFIAFVVVPLCYYCQEQAGYVFALFCLSVGLSSAELLSKLRTNFHFHEIFWRGRPWNKKQYRLAYFQRRDDLRTIPGIFLGQPSPNLNDEVKTTGKENMMPLCCMFILILMLKRH